MPDVAVPEIPQSDVDSMSVMDKNTTTPTSDETVEGATNTVLDKADEIAELLTNIPEASAEAQTVE